MQTLLIDSEDLLRLSLKEVVRGLCPDARFLEARSEKQLLRLAAMRIQPDLILLHPASLPDVPTPWPRMVRRLFPRARCLHLVDARGAMPERLDGMTALSRASSIGAVSATLHRLIASLQMPNRTHPDTKAKKADNTVLERLSHRQRQILTMAADGLPNKEIGARLGIAEGTVKAHMHAIFKTLKVTNRTQAVLRLTGLTHGGDRTELRSPASGHTLPPRPREIAL